MSGSDNRTAGTAANSKVGTRVRTKLNQATQPSPRETATSSAGFSQRNDYEADDFQGYRELGKKPSTVDKGAIQANAELKRYLDAAESNPKSLPARTRVDWSDSNARSPWSEKIILTLDGGGVKGLSSLLILKRLIFLIKEIELGVRRNNLNGKPDYYPSHPSSHHSPWIDCDGADDERDTPKIDEDDEDIRESVERCLEEEQGNEYKLCHYFDYIAGTSTGGLSAIMFSRLEMSVQDAINQYDVLGNAVFGRPNFFASKTKLANWFQPIYSTKRTEEAFISIIKNGLEEELMCTKMSAEEATFQNDPWRCRTIVISHGPTESNNVEREYIFRTYDHHYPSPLARERYKKDHRNPGGAHADPIWKIARATSAAPKYFENISFNGRTFRDGGMVANNPAKVALQEVCQMHEVKPKMLVSIGTGLPKKKKRPTKKTHNNVPFLIDWGNLLKAMAQLLTQSGHIEREVDNTCERDKIDYFRWNVPNGMGDIHLDEWIPAQGGWITKEKIHDFAMDYLSERKVHRRFLQCARSLVRIRRMRAKTERWERFARKSVYFCPDFEHSSGKVTKTFFTRDELREHCIHEHQYISNVDIKNMDELHHTCVFGHCGIDTVCVFRDQEGLERHLLEEHDVDNPTFMSLRRMEAWLDKGRWSRASAVKRQDSELQRQIQEWEEEENKKLSVTHKGKEKACAVTTPDPEVKEEEAGNSLRRPQEGSTACVSSNGGSDSMLAQGMQSQQLDRVETIAANSDMATVQKASTAPAQVNATPASPPRRSKTLRSPIVFRKPFG